MSETSPIGSDPMVEAAREGAWKKVEALWLDRLDKDDRDTRPFLEVARLLAAARESDRLKVLGSMTAGVFLQAGADDAVVALARTAAAARADDPELVEALLGAARRIHADHSLSEALVTRADLERGRGLSHVLDLLEAFFRFDVGDLVRHTGGWGFGDVKKIVTRREELHVVFETGREHVFPMRTAGEYLNRYASDTIEARLRRDLEALRAEARKDPLAVVTSALEHRGGSVDGKDLKDLLVPGVLDEGEWGGWWNGARDRLRKHPYFDITTGANPRITRREIPKTYADDAQGKFSVAKTFWERLKILRHYAKTVKRREADGGFLREAFAALAAAAATGGERIALAFLAEDVRASVPDGAPADVPKDLALDTLEPLVAQIEFPEYKGRLLAEARARFAEGWQALFARLLSHEDPEVLAPAVEALKDAGRQDLLRTAVVDLVAASRRRPRAFLWFFREVFLGRLEGLEGVPPATDLVDRLLDIHHGAVTERIAEGNEAKHLTARARACLSDDTLRKAFDQVSHAVAKRLWHRIRTERLSRVLTRRAERIVADRFPELIGSDEGPARAAEEDRSIWSSAAGLARRRRDYDHLINVEFARNAEALGHAISMGDLSENAEYDAAREEQRRLTDKARLMEEELRAAKVIQPSALLDTVVGIGSAVVVADEQGAERRYALLGPWDTDLDRGIISYQSPIGQALLGKKPGDVVQVRLPDGERTLAVRTTAQAPELTADETQGAAGEPNPQG